MCLSNPARYRINSDTPQFDGATFNQGVGFKDVTFHHDARFDGATFHRPAMFVAIFHQDVRFDRATFHRAARFGSERLPWESAVVDGLLDVDGARCPWPAGPQAADNVALRHPATPRAADV